METILDRAKDILERPHIKKIAKIPAFMPQQRKLVEFARDAALYIIDSESDNQPPPDAGKEK